MATPTDILERDAELHALAGAFAAAADGRGGTVVVSGEAGIGKSTLVRRFLAQVDARILYGTCDDLSVPRPLGALRDIGGPAAAAAAAGAPPHEVYPLLLGDLAESGPTILVLEDVHWADDATLDAATYLTRRVSTLPALLVMTMREGESASDDALQTMLGAAATAQARFMPLAPLSESAVAALGGTHDVYTATKGNPFLVTELLGGGDDPFPATVANAALARAAHLDDASRALVELLSVVPGKVPLDILDLMAPGWLEAAKEPERRRLLELTVKHVQFRHELVRRAIESSLSSTKIRELNAHIVDILVSVDWDPSDIVHHAEAAGAEDVVAANVLPAARRAARLESNREAYAHYRRTIDFIQRLTPHEQAVVREEFGAAAYYAGHLDEALEATRMAVEMYKRQGKVESHGRCMRVLSRLLWFAGDGAGARDTARDAVTILEPLGPSTHLAAAYGTRARLAMLQRELDEAQHWGAMALELADAVGDNETKIQARVTLATGNLLVDPGAFEDLYAAHAAAHAAGDREEATRALANLAYTYLVWGVAGPALAVAREGIAYAEKYEVHHMSPYNFLTAAWLDLRAGRWAEAERAATQYAHSKVNIHRLLALDRARRAGRPPRRRRRGGADGGDPGAGAEDRRAAAPRAGARVDDRARPARGPDPLGRAHAVLYARGGPRTRTRSSASRPGARSPAWPSR